MHSLGWWDSFEKAPRMRTYLMEISGSSVESQGLLCLQLPDMVIV